jgi:RHS repeat-associated protein
MDYAPFGQDLYTGLLIPNERFALLARDGEAGLDYAEARMYQVRTGRFNAPDSVYDGLLNPQNWNRYQYALSNPIRIGDPDGRNPRQATVLSRRDWESLGGFFSDYAGSVGGPWPYSEIVRLEGEWERQRREGGPLGGRRRPNNTNPGNDSDDNGTDDDDKNTGGNTSCQQFSTNIVNFVSRGTSGIFSRLGTLYGTGAQMMGMGAAAGLPAMRTRPPLRAPGSSGFRPNLVSHEQNQDVYKHVLYAAGATISGSPTGAPFMLWDGFETALGSQSGSEEVRGDLAGAGVGAATLAWALTGDTPTLRRRITSILCQ